MRIEDVDQGVETSNFRVETGISSPAIPVYAEAGDLVVVFHDRIGDTVEVQNDLPGALRIDAPTVETKEFADVLNGAADRGETIYVTLHGLWAGKMGDRVFKFEEVSETKRGRMILAVRDSRDALHEFPIIHYEITPQRNLRDGQELA